MKTAKAAAIAILFLLIPHQEPRADEPAATAQPTTRTERSVPGDVAERDGYLWSLSASRGDDDAFTGEAEHRQIDGYSWSARRPADSTF